MKLLAAIPEWQERANCQGTDGDKFYPEKGGSPLLAKRICRGCEVKTECLEWALDRNEQHGVWGGLSENERKALKKSGARTSAVAA